MYPFFYKGWFALKVSVPCSVTVDRQRSCSRTSILCPMQGPGSPVRLCRIVFEIVMQHEA